MDVAQCVLQMLTSGSRCSTRALALEPEKAAEGKMGAGWVQTGGPPLICSHRGRKNADRLAALV